MTRISNHLLAVGSHIMDVGAMTPNLWLFELREQLLGFFERASGARMHSNWFRPGGVHQDVPPDLLEDIDRWLSSYGRMFEEGVALAADNPIFKVRPTGFNHLQALEFITKGHMLADVTAILGSLDILFGEIGR